MFNKTGRLLSLVNFSDDQPTEVRGSLIPQGNQKPRRPRRSVAVPPIVTTVGASFVAVLLLAAVAVSGYGVMATNSLASVVTVNLFDPATNTTVTLEYGQQESLADPDLFTQARDAFVEQAVTFIEVDLDAKIVRYFQAGVLTVSAEILATGVEGSWWDAPSGLYTIESKEANDFSNVNQVYLPSNLVFGGNYMIHGIPAYPNNRPVTEAFVGGGIRVPTSVATDLFKAVSVGTPVLVHKSTAKNTDDFTYVPAPPTLKASHFLVTDIGNDTVLATSKSTEPVPIASITKLMTAVVAAEKLNLDNRVQITAPNFVTSLIPRLAERTSVSMYSLLQLLLTESSNEAAEVIAGEYGSEAFVAAMNAKARQIGMTSTTFADASGLSDDNVSSAEDITTLATYIKNNRQFIFDLTEKTELSVIGTGEFSDLQNFNRIDGVTSFIGGKIGETTAAGQTVVSLHEVEIKGSPRTISIVVLGSTDWRSDVQTILQYIEEQFNQ